MKVAILELLECSRGDQGCLDEELGGTCGHLALEDHVGLLVLAFLGPGLVDGG